MSIVVLLDSSSSQRGLYEPLAIRDRLLSGTGQNIRTPALLEEIARAIGANVGPNTQVRLGSFGAKIVLSTEWIRRPSVLVDGLRAVLQDGGPSPISDAVFAAVDALRSAHSQRAIVVLSDGFNSGNLHGISETISHANRYSVAVHAIELVDGADGANRSQVAERPLHRLAEATGGRLLSGGRFESRRRKGVATLLSELLRALSEGFERQPGSLISRAGASRWVLKGCGGQAGDRSMFTNHPLGAAVV